MSAQSSVIIAYQIFNLSFYKFYFIRVCQLIKEKLLQREGHFMKAGLLQSQLKTLEVPQHSISVDISLPPEEIINKFI